MGFPAEKFMTAKPILFNSKMVKAIYEDRKTVTRRLVKPKYRNNEYGYSICRRAIDNSIAYIAYTDEDGALTRDMAPPYFIGDILYIRETWKHAQDVYGDQPPTYVYKVGEKSKNGFCLPDLEVEDRWHPSIHMPKEAARIWLKVTDVRVERLQDISREQIFKEGCGTGSGIDPNDYAKEEWYEFHGLDCDYDRASFAGLWESTVNDKDTGKYGWGANPWVWVIEFERIDNPAAKTA